MRDHLPWRSPQRGPHLHLCPPPGCCHPSSHSHMVLRESDQVTFFVRKPPGGASLHSEEKPRPTNCLHSSLFSLRLSPSLPGSDHTGRSHTAGVPLPEDFVPKRGHIKGGLGEADQDGCQQRPVPVSLPRHSRALGPPQTTRAGLHCVF